MLGLVGTKAPLRAPEIPALAQRAFDLADRLGFARHRLAELAVPTPTCGLAGATPDWARTALGLCRQKLKRVSDALGERDWLAGPFSIADIAMVTVLNTLRHTRIVAEYPKLTAYKARGEERPAYQRALAAQLADFENEPSRAA